jgi:predicted nucleic acid binding AN1-type Zn finger protein
MCRRKLGLAALKCKCNQYYCSAHRHAENHGCSFDYKVTGKQALSVALVQVRGDKLPERL